MRDGPCALVDFAHPGGPLWLEKPLVVLTARSASEVAPLLEEVRKAARGGLWAVGCLAYEAAAAFALPVRPVANGTVLAWFGLFDRARPALFPAVADPGRFACHLPLTRHAYQYSLETIREAILAGETYQVNFTLPATLPDLPDPASLFLYRHVRHRHPWSLWIHFGDDLFGPEQARMAASFSPEMFFRLQGDWLLSGPIKGTCGLGEEEGLLASAKERAEHVMIVDMARNDLGRICRTGSIAVPSFMERRDFATVHHLESVVRGRLREGVGLAALFEALFPAASITGAPRYRTMEWIRELERVPRGLYTGTMGLLPPGGEEASFNVAIRTLTWNPRDGGRLGLGGGIVAEADPAAEWQELHHKAAFLTRNFDLTCPGLLETMRVQADGVIPWLERHLARLTRSARVLGLPCEVSTVREVVRRALEKRPESTDVLRLELHPDGSIGYTWRLGERVDGGLRVRLARWRMDRQDPLLQHKTTRRERFQRELQQARELGCQESLFLNNRGCLTEGTIRGLAVLGEDGSWRVSPLEEGLLPSLWRQAWMVATGAREEALDRDALLRAKAVVMGNAVQGSQWVREVVDADGRHLATWQAADEILPVTFYPG
ncbi:MAG: chorismate-binding protein [Magnetococcales bacterium]|nr:chorismate-binding protein [Magnetococcales bacterium]